MFDRGWTLFRVRGIPIRIDFTLLLFLPYLAFVTSLEFERYAKQLGYAPAELHVPAIVWGIILAVAVFASVLLHELAHSLVALRDGARVRSITLMMLGGVSMIEDEVPPEKETWMAFVGPLTSLVIAAVAWGLYRVLPLPAGPAVALGVLALINLVIGIFNLIPAFPMDGGRVLRSLLARRYGLERATEIASRVGKTLAVLFGLWGAMTFNFILLLIALFIFFGATAEQKRFEARASLSGVPISRLMTRRVGEARIYERTGDVARRMLEQDQIAARVVDGRDAEHPTGRTVGIVTTWELVRAEAEKGGDAPVAASLTSAPVVSVHEAEDASRLVDALLPTGRAGAAIVLDETEAPVGIVTSDDLSRALSVARASRRRSRRSGRDAR